MTTGNSTHNYDDWREERRHKWEERRARRMARMSRGGIYSGHGGPGGHLVFGGIVLLLGILFLLQNLGILYVERIWHFWPVILIAVGMARFLDGRDSHSQLSGAILAGIGFIFLANGLGYLPWYYWRLLWPGLLILWGIVLLSRSSGGHSHWTRHSFVDDASTISDKVLKEVVLFGGIHRKVAAQDFQGGEATAIFGGIEIDLRGAATTKDEVSIEANAVFGGVELIVPDTWDVTIRGTGVLGGYEDKSHPAPLVEGMKRPRLVIHGSAVFGGVNVRS